LPECIPLSAQECPIVHAWIRRLATLALLAFVPGREAWAQDATRPNILVIWGDDIGVHNISAYNH
jgi:arylsulfatase